ncbi:MAG TPA: hypothetical protein VLM91_21015 [Candidatus Methylomirabilis sp.]|nr:hypothetical protein [Candidatus Methylomirabilis sp.]
MTTPSPTAGSGWAESLQRLARHIPGLGGYQDREGLRETDKLVRMYLAGLIANLPLSLETAERRLEEARQLDRLPALDRVARVLRRLADRVQFASYGFAGVFDLRKIQEVELAALHRFDLGLLEALPRLQERVSTLADAAMDAARFPQALQAMETALQEFERSLEERDKLAHGL